MEEIVDARDLLRFCLEKQEEMRKRDWVAALTFLTTRKGLDLQLPELSAFNEALLSRLHLFRDGIYLLCHRLGVLGFSPSLWRLCPVLSDRIASLKPKEMAVIAWSLAKNMVTDEDVWDEIGKATLASVDVLDGEHLALLLWSFAKVERRKPKEILAIKQRLLFATASPSMGLNKSLPSDTRKFQQEQLKGDAGKALNTQRSQETPNSSHRVEAEEKQSECSQGPSPSAATSAPARLRASADSLPISLSMHDLCMATRAAATLTPRDVPFCERMLEAVRVRVEMEGEAILPQGWTSLWTVVAELKIRNPQIIEMLCEESRRLRLDHTFNQNMAVEIAVAVKKMGLKDPRVLFQLIHFVETRANRLRAEQLLEMAELFRDLGIDHDGAWKQMGVRAQKSAISLDLRGIHRLAAAFHGAGKGNQKVFGILQHFAMVKDDQRRYGPS
uniref:Uncharacterized protein n=1 Tax=Chromera velia CCMP2878 TaxID=1169474 RepID=A0A0G4HIE9_9ALVE|eukprot:Cvel_27949.t1-p1 / transcript=Cvel_27949.t1 / gene=Cvel_27949 / organism=Chromera_velia_CCMP2878 / gene_product=hypothetical protein / transcript_product=hypothetical protein / location=Cvel_scaffold3567:2612-8324(-) / protein_length=443 / sequence_SO=supercontig / SO=protein_coding / is_pseudo=false